MANSNSGTDEPSTDPPSTDEQFGAVTTSDGDTIVYDRTNSAAWIQSDYAVEFGGTGSSA